MATSRSLEPIISSLLLSTRPSTTRYVCAPCFHRQQITQRRHASNRKKYQNQIPEPTPFVPDVDTFLKLIGRNLSSQSSKIESWKHLFSSNTDTFKKAGIEPPRTRRYLLRWCDKFRRGLYGPGGDFEHVKDGVAHLRVVEVPELSKKATQANGSEYVSTSQTPGMKKLLLNVPEGSTSYMLAPGQTTADLKKPNGYTLKNGFICGPYAQPLKLADGGGAVVKVREGMWEDLLGKKVFGGERRRAETLHKMGVAEHRKATGTAR